MSKPKICVFESEVHAIGGEALRHPRSETGGDLYGLFTHGGMPVVWLASGPGPNSSGHGTEFSQDPMFITHWQRVLNQRFAIQYIGSWHSHHVLGLKHPSGGDVDSVRKYAKKHGRSKTLELLVNFDSERSPLIPFLRAFFYGNAETGHYEQVDIESIRGVSPLRTLLGSEEHAFSAGLAITDTRARLVPSTAVIQPERTYVPSPIEGQVKHETIEALLVQLGIDEIELLGSRDGQHMIQIPIRGGSLTMVLSVDQGLSLLGGRFDSADGAAGDLFKLFIEDRQIVLPMKLNYAIELSRLVSAASSFIQRVANGKSRTWGWRR